MGGVNHGHGGCMNVCLGRGVGLRVGLYMGGLGIEGACMCDSEVVWLWWVHVCLGEV